ncbi:MAG: acetyl-CoA carboxylase biotin carboxyl carrier protein subunit, partial [Janthinobacterium lividum]
LAVLEAMKMEMSVRAPFDGVVTRVATTAGAQVQLGALLLQVDHAGSRDGLADPGTGPGTSTVTEEVA